MAPAKETRNGVGTSLQCGSYKKGTCGGQVDTTNNRLELTAAIVGVETLIESWVVKLTTDWEYIKKGVLEWIESCRKKRWLTTNKEPVKNQYLWKRLDRQLI